MEKKQRHSHRKNRRSVGQNHQISEMSDEFCDEKLIQKNAQCFWVTWSSIYGRLHIFLAYFPSNLQYLLNVERPVFKQSTRVLLFLSGSFLFCQTKFFSLLGSYPATSQKISKRLKALISFEVTAKLTCAFVFAYAKCWFFLMMRLNYVCFRLHLQKN